MQGRYGTIIEALTGRNVVAGLSQGQVEPDITGETFFVDSPRPGIGRLCGS